MARPEKQVSNDKQDKIGQFSQKAILADFLSLNHDREILIFLFLKVEIKKTCKTLIYNSLESHHSLNLYLIDTK